tara:strand:+ start:1390 stop:1605 length:216 start_codon:yes stop_codon:yes gene_type:complete
MFGKKNKKDSKGKKLNDISEIPKRGPLPNLPKLSVSILESPEVAGEISNLRAKRAYVSQFFMEVLEDEKNN